MARSADQKRVHVLFRGRLVPKDQLPVVEAKSVEVEKPEPDLAAAEIETEFVAQVEPLVEVQPVKKRGRPAKKKPENEDVSAFELKD